MTNHEIFFFSSKNISTYASITGVIVFSLVVNDSVSLVISRQILTDITNHLTKLPDDLSKSVSHFTLDKVSILIFFTNKSDLSIMYLFLIAGY